MCQIAYHGGGMDAPNLVTIRQANGLTQKQTAAILGMPLRTYIRYERTPDYGDKMKRSSMMASLQERFEVNEDKGILSIDVIREKLRELFDNRYSGKIDFCYLFGSYAKGYATESSDVDLCISTSLTGLKLVGLSEAIRESLSKKTDIVRFASLSDNVELLSEIMKDGIKIYG